MTEQEKPLVCERMRKVSQVRRQESINASTASYNWSGSQAHVQTGGSSKMLEAGDEIGPDVVAPAGKVTWPLAITATVAILGSSFPHGWNTGVLNTPAQLIHNFLNETYIVRFGFEPEPWKRDILWAISVSVYLVGGCGGALSAGWFADRFGRKKALLICHVFCYVAAILFGFCDLAKSFEMLIIARLVVGFGCGAGSGLVPMYLCEIAPVNMRGAMGVLHQFALTFGILVSQFMGLRQILGRENIWPILLAFIIVPVTLSMVVLPWYPESPRYLLVNKNLEDEARHALQRFRGTVDVEADMEEMRAEREIQLQDPKWSFRKLFSDRGLRMPLILVCSLAMCQQLSGINVVFYYSTGVFLSSGIPEDVVQYANIGTGAINFLMTGISVPLMEKSGRRPLLFGGMILMVISASGLTMALNLQASIEWMSYVSIICVITFVIGFAIGLGSIPQFIGAELFRQGPRPPAMSFSGLLNWLCNFIVGITFPSMQTALREYSFIIFIAIVLGFGIFLWFKLPETKHKSYDEIYQIFQTTSKTSDDDDSEEKGMIELESVTTSNSNSHDTHDDVKKSIDVTDDVTIKTPLNNDNVSLSNIRTSLIGASNLPPTYDELGSNEMDSPSGTPHQEVVDTRENEANIKANEKSEGKKILEDSKTLLIDSRYREDIPLKQSLSEDKL